MPTTTCNLVALITWYIFEVTCTEDLICIQKPLCCSMKSLQVLHSFVSNDGHDTSRSFNNTPV